MVSIIDLPVYERRSRLVWHKRRYCCPDEQSARVSWTEEDPRIGAPRMTMTDPRRTLGHRAGGALRENGRRGRPPARL